MSIIDDVAKKIEVGERLSEADALALYESADLLEVGSLADEVNRRKNKDLVFFNVNRHINPTNICALSCKFCAYSRKPGEEGAYAYSIEEMVKKAGEAVAQGATEVHMVGGLHPRWQLSHYKDMLRAIKAAHPDLHIKAFTAVELDWFARRARKTTKEVLGELVEAGLGSLPGGGAEIFHPEIREAICDTKVPAEKWLETHRLAHQLGLKTNCTMLYGHIEAYRHRIDHMRRLRELQDETHGFNAFIPLSFQPFQNAMGIDKYTFGYDDLKTIAIARLFLDNFQHIKAYWIMLGQDVAQMALQFGANDLDGTVIEEKISRMAGGRAGMGMTRPGIEKMVRKAKRFPRERDTLYNVVSEPRNAPTSATRAGAASAPSVVPSLDSLRALINKADYEARLEHDELLALAAYAYQHELGGLAARIRDARTGGQQAQLLPVIVPPLAKLKTTSEVLRYINEQVQQHRAQFKLTPTTIAFDLTHFRSESNFESADATATDDSEAGLPEIGSFLELIWSVGQSLAAFELSVWGLRGLWQLAQAENVSIGDLAGRLREAGISSIESSPEESETDLTLGEIVEIHAQIHSRELCTVAKVELLAEAQGNGEPLWDAFLKRIEAFAGLHERTGGLYGLSIEAAPASFVSPVEYMRALALARIAAPEIPHIVAPLARIPVMSPTRGLGTSDKQHPVEKIAAVSLHYGADDLGALIAGRLSPIAICQEIRSAGFVPSLRTVHSTTNVSDHSHYSESYNIKHMPHLRF